MKSTENSKTTPRPLKNILIVLLALATLAGYAINAYLFYCAATNTLPKQLIDIDLEQLKQFNMEQFNVLKPERISNLLELSPSYSSKGLSLTFQGTMSGDKNAVAIINGKMVTVGSEIEGIRVLQINSRKITVEYLGQTQEIGIGETVTVH